MATTTHELESLRRSLAIGNGLPADQIRRLLDNCAALLENHDARTTRDKQLREKIEALRPVVAELRRHLAAIATALDR